MSYENFYKNCTYLDCDRIVPKHIEPISHVTLGEAVDLRRQNAGSNGRISTRSFALIREFRAKMADYDKKWGRG